MTSVRIEDPETKRQNDVLKALGRYPWSEEETAEFEPGTTFLAVYDIGHENIMGEWVEMIGERVQVMVTEAGWIGTNGQFLDHYTIIPKSITHVTPPIAQTRRV